MRQTVVELEQETLEEKPLEIEKVSNLHRLAKRIVDHISTDLAEKEGRQIEFRDLTEEKVVTERPRCLGYLE